MHGKAKNTGYGVLFWLVYLVVAVACWASTYQVFKQSDTPLVAALAATAVDGVLALTMFIMGRSTGRQSTAALIGTCGFAIISLMAQIIQRFNGLGQAMPYELQLVSLFLVPASTTLSLVLLGVIKYFDQDGNGKLDFLERGRGQVTQTPRPMPRAEMAEIPSAPQPALGDRSNGNGHKVAVTTYQESLPEAMELRRVGGAPAPLVGPSRS